MNNRNKYSVGSIGYYKSICTPEHLREGYKEYKYNRTYRKFKKARRAKIVKLK